MKLIALLFLLLLGYFALTYGLGAMADVIANAIIAFGDKFWSWTGGFILLAVICGVLFLRKA